MSRRRWEQDQQAFSHRRREHHCLHRGIFPLVSLVLGIAAFFMTIVFRVVEVFFNTFLGMLEGRPKETSAAPKNGDAENSNGRGPAKSGAANANTADKTAGGTGAETSDSYQAAAAEATVKPPKDAPKAEKKKEASKKNEEKSGGEEKGDAGQSHRSKDWYVILFIMTMIPCTVALAMGKLVFAGLIALAGLGLLILSALIIGLASGFRKKPAAAGEPEREEEQQDDAVEKLIKEAFEKLFEIRKESDRVENPSIRGKIDGICSIGEKIIGEVRTNPDNLKLVKKFFYYYLDAFAEIVRKYLRLFSFTAESDDVLKLVAETEKSFDDIEAIFKELCEKLVEKDMLDLKAEINVIKNSN